MQNYSYQVTRKRLVFCPVCKHGGTMNVLGEITPTGDFMVIRFHKGITRISGDNYTIYCETHAEPVYFRLGTEGGTF